MDPIAFYLGSIAIHWYGIAMAAGFFLGLYTARRRAAPDGIQVDSLYDLALWLIVGGIAGARLWYVIEYWEQDFAGQSFINVFKLRQGGLVYYGGFVGACIAGTLCVRLKKLPFLKMADALAPSISLGQALGRVGCFMTGCCYGRGTDAICGVQFPFGHETHGSKVHPTQLYEAGLSLCLYVALEWVYKKKKFPGMVFGTYLMAYAVVRSFVELFRGDYTSYTAGWITPAHWVSAMLFISGGILLMAQKRRSRQKV